MASKKPHVSFVLLSYNQEKFIEAAVDAALSQDFSDIEFIFSDDHSTDSTYALIEKKCEFSNKNIILNRNFKNFGISGHFNHVMNIAKGEIIVVAAGDDVSLPDRVSNSVRFFDENHAVSFLSFNDFLINEHGTVMGTISKIEYPVVFGLKEFVYAKRLPISGASRAFRRKLYDEFGMLHLECPTEDTPYLLRGLFIGNGAIVNSAGIYYRVHSSSLSSPSNIKKMNSYHIKRQYESDIIEAKKKLFIKDVDEKLILQWVDYTFLSKQKNTLNGFSKLIVFLEILFSKLFFIKLLKSFK